MEPYIRVFGVHSGIEGVFSCLTRRITITSAPTETLLLPGHQVLLERFAELFEEEDWDESIVIKGTETLLWEYLVLGRGASWRKKLSVISDCGKT